MVAVSFLVLGVALLCYTLCMALVDARERWNAAVRRRRQAMADLDTAYRLAVQDLRAEGNLRAWEARHSGTERRRRG